jgi:hypothetical protein
VFFLRDCRHHGEIRRATPAIDQTGNAQDGKKENVDQAAPISRKGDICEKSRHQSKRDESQEPKKLATRIEFSAIDAGLSKERPELSRPTSLARRSLGEGGCPRASVL